MLHTAHKSQNNGFTSRWSGKLIPRIQYCISYEHKPYHFFYRFAFGLTKKTLHDSPRDIFSLFSFHFILSFSIFFLRLFFSFVHHVHRSERLNFMHTIYAKMTKKMRTIAVKKIDRCWARARKPFSICNCQWNSFSDGIRNV